VAAKAGLRLGELLGLEWPDCELVKGAGTINVRRQWTRLRELAPPKAGSRRPVPISNELVRLLLELKMRSADKSGPVFASRTGSRLSHRNVERRGFDAAAADAGLEGVTLHDLRHAYGSRLASKGLSARQIADAMGHKRTSTTELYIQRFNGEEADDRVRAAMSG
jgi:integrase